jgi:hypothetical protein
MLINRPFVVGGIVFAVVFFLSVVFLQTTETGSQAPVTVNAPDQLAGGAPPPAVVVVPDGEAPPPQDVVVVPDTEVVAEAPATDAQPVDEPQPSNAPPIDLDNLEPAAGGEMPPAAAGDPPPRDVPPMGPGAMPPPPPMSSGQGAPPPVPTVPPPAPAAAPPPPPRVAYGPPVPSYYGPPMHDPEPSGGSGPSAMPPPAGGSGPSAMPPGSSAPSSAPPSGGSSAPRATPRFNGLVATGTSNKVLSYFQQARTRIDTAQAFGFVLIPRAAISIEERSVHKSFCETMLATMDYMAPAAVSSANAATPGAVLATYWPVVGSREGFEIKAAFADRNCDDLIAWYDYKVARALAAKAGVGDMSGPLLITWPSSGGDETDRDPLVVDFSRANHARAQLALQYWFRQLKNRPDLWTSRIREGTIRAELADAVNDTAGVVLAVMSGKWDSLNTVTTVAAGSP